MECDGLKKVLVMDKDGTLFGQPTVILPQSEWQWDKDPSYGIGDSKVPVRMITRPDGTKFSVDTQWPQKGNKPLFYVAHQTLIRYKHSFTVHSAAVSSFLGLHWTSCGTSVQLSSHVFDDTVQACGLRYSVCSSTRRKLEKCSTKMKSWMLIWNWNICEPGSTKTFF